MTPHSLRPGPRRGRRSGTGRQRACWQNSWPPGPNPSGTITISVTCASAWPCGRAGAGTAKGPGSLPWHFGFMTPSMTRGPHRPAPMSSAALAGQPGRIIRAGAGSDAAQRVHDLVMATQHDAPAALASSPDAHCCSSTLTWPSWAAPPERFECYDQDVRKEYAWVPASRYREGRTKCFAGFLGPVQAVPLRARGGSARRPRPASTWPARWRGSCNERARRQQASRRARAD